MVDYGCSYSALKYVNKDPDLNFKVSNTFYTVLIQKKKKHLYTGFVFGMQQKINRLQFEIKIEEFHDLRSAIVCVVYLEFMFGLD